MKERKRHLYRVVFVSGPSAASLIRKVGGLEDRVWWFPPEPGATMRCYQTRKAAEYRAGYWRQHGVVTRVERSNPITWPEEA